MDKIPSKVARRQAVICLALIREIDQAVVNSRQPADQVLARIYRQHREYGGRDRRFFSNAVFSWFRWRGWLKTPTNENVAAAILLDASEIPPQLEYFGLNSSKADLKPAGRLTLEEKVEYLRLQLNFTSLRIDESGRKVRQPKTVAGLAEAGPGSTPPATILSTEGGSASGGKFSYLELAPDWVSDALFIPPNRNPEAHLRQCLETFQTRPPTWLRLPAGRIQPALSWLNRDGIEVESHPLIKTAVFVKGNKSFDSGKFPEIEVQDLASQCVGLGCAPKAGEEWWDMCAGSGGKSFHLADLIRGRGRVLATDIRSSILSQLAKRLKRDGRSVRPLLWDGSSDPLAGMLLDGVLIDAPCSGLGTWHRNPDARWRTSAIQIRDYADIQKNLLQIAAGKVRPGGRLVYSICTLTKAESMDIITTFLEQNRAFQLEELINPLNHEPANGIIWIWPWEWNCNGMFIAVIKKVSAISLSQNHKNG